MTLQDSISPALQTLCKPTTETLPKAPNQYQTSAISGFSLKICIKPPFTAARLSKSLSYRLIPRPPR